MKKLSDYNFWFITGSQFLYGPETLKQVEEDSIKIVEGLNNSKSIPCNIQFKSVMKTAEEISEIVKEANYSNSCAGVIVFMHTFSPSKMWINGLVSLQKPYCHLHTQYNRNIPNLDIDMDFMNLNQSAHGDREHGYIGARLAVARKIIAGFWDNEEVKEKLGDWMRVAVAVAISKSLKVMRFGDNMREVAVTEGDKVEAQRVFGWQVNTWPVGQLAQEISNVRGEEVELLLKQYQEEYILNTGDIESVRYQARIEIAIEKMLKDENCSSYSNTFEDLYGMKQLPGLASQHLMQKGYGFGAEGDWKTSALTHIMKVMGEEKGRGTSFIEDYTYDLSEGEELSLGAHMLEVCPTIAEDKPRIEVHPLSIGGKEPPARLVFEGKAGKAILATIVDMGNRYRLIVHEIECVKPIYDMPNLPVARVMWKAEPNFSIGTECWLIAGGAHHSVLSYDVTVEMMRDFARILGVEFVHIGKDTKVAEFEEHINILNTLAKIRY